MPVKPPRVNRPHKNGTLEWIPTDRCVMLSRNPQWLTPAQLAGLKRSIERDGFVAPILVRPIAGKRFEVISGNHRFLAAQALGQPTVPAIVKRLDDRAAKRLAVNLNTIHGDPTAELLAPFLADLDDAALGEVHLEAEMLDALVAFDADLAQKLATLSVPAALDRPSPTGSIEQCRCPTCGKAHIATRDEGDGV